MIKLFNENLPNRSSKILEPSSSILCWDDIRNKQYMELWTQMTEFFWVSKEVSMGQDSQHWVTVMKPHEKETYKKAIGQLAVLDSIATVYDTLISQFIGDPAVKACYSFVASMESIHAHSYTYCLSSFTNSAEMLEVFENPKKSKVMLDRNKLVTDVYDEFVNNPTKENALKSLVANMVLESLFFSNGFTYFFHLARNGKMIGTQTIVSLIKRDEVIHGVLGSYIIRDICTEYPELNTTWFIQWCYSMVKLAVQKEKDWGRELYANSPEINMEELDDYIEWTGNNILDSLGLHKVFDTKVNPMKWVTVYDPSNSNGIKTDFFEGKPTYARPSDSKQDWGDL